MEYAKMTSAQLEEEYASVSRRFGELKGMGLKLDMSRGKPGKEQLDLVSDILTVLSKPEDCVEESFDVRNYGVHPRPAPQREALEQAGHGKIPVSISGL